MAELTNLETKLGEVLGLAMAAQGATDKVQKLDDLKPELKQRLERMHEEAKQTEERATEVAGTFEGKKTAILEEAREVKQKATEMMSDYLDQAADALDGFEFLTMAEAGEVGHWEILKTLNERARQLEPAGAVRLGDPDPAAPLRGRAQRIADARGRGGSERDELEARRRPERRGPRRRRLPRAPACRR